MRKSEIFAATIFLVAAAACLFSVTGCGKKAIEVDNASTTSPATASSSDTPAVVVRERSAYRHEEAAREENAPERRYDRESAPARTAQRSEYER